MGYRKGKLVLNQVNFFSEVGIDSFHLSICLELSEYKTLEHFLMFFRRSLFQEELSGIYFETKEP